MGVKGLAASSGAGGPIGRAGALLMTNFDTHAFHYELLEKKHLANSTHEGRGTFCLDIDLERRDGIRLVLETCERQDRQELLPAVAGVLSPIDEFELEPLFQGADRETPVSGETDLACFWLLRICGMSYFEVSQNHFDLAYHLLDRLELKSVEPDIPYVGFECPDEDQAPPAGSNDRAWHLRRMNVKRAWDHSGQRGAGICIGHPDTGYADHVDLDPARIRQNLGFDFVDMKPDPVDVLDNAAGAAHGTATGSVIMSGGTIVSPPAAGEGGTGAPGTVTGLVPEAELVPVRAAQSVRRIFSSRLAQAIYHCRKSGCAVISIGIGGHPSRALFHALQDAVRHDIVVVAAAGNRVGGCDRAVWPARFGACIGLAASNDRDEPWSHTCQGSGVDIAAPGEGVWRAIREGSDACVFRAGPANGTSYAAANAAGAAALWLGHHGRDKLARMARKSGTTVQALFRKCLTETARQPDNWDTKRCGPGIIDLYELLRVLPPKEPDSRSAPSILTEYRGHIQSVFGLSGNDEFNTCLAAMFKTHAHRDPVARWGHELSEIATRLETSGSPALAKLRSDHTLSIRDRAEILAAIIRPLASESLTLELAGIHSEI